MIYSIYMFLQLCVEAKFGFQKYITIDIHTSSTSYFLTFSAAGRVTPCVASVSSAKTRFGIGSVACSRGMILCFECNRRYNEQHREVQGCGTENWAFSIF